MLAQLFGTEVEIGPSLELFRFPITVYRDGEVTITDEVDITTDKGIQSAQASARQMSHICYPSASVIEIGEPQCLS